MLRKQKGPKRTNLDWEKVRIFAASNKDTLRVTARHEAVQTMYLLDCFVVPPRNDGTRQKKQHHAED